MDGVSLRKRHVSFGSKSMMELVPCLSAEGVTTTIVLNKSANSLPPAGDGAVAVDLIHDSALKQTRCQKTQSTSRWVHLLVVFEGKLQGKPPTV